VGGTLGFRSHNPGVISSLCVTSGFLPHWIWIETLNKKAHSEYSMGQNIDHPANKLLAW